MSYYNWEQIFKNKTEKELLTIYKGQSHLESEAELYAGLELQSRKYDFSQIKEIHERKLATIQREIDDYHEFGIRKSDFYNGKLWYVIGFVLVVVVLIVNNDYSFENFRFIKAIFYLTICAILILTTKWSFKSYQLKKEKAFQKKKELLERLMQGQTLGG